MSWHYTTRPPGGVSISRVVEPLKPDDYLLERILSRENMLRVWKRVKANKKATGVDGMSNEQFPDVARDRWDQIRQSYDQPVAEGSGPGICQRTLGENPLPGYGPVSFVNRLVRAYRECLWGRPACYEVWGGEERNSPLSDWQIFFLPQRQLPVYDTGKWILIVWFNFSEAERLIKMHSFCEPFEGIESHQ